MYMYVTSTLTCWFFFLTYNYYNEYSVRCELQLFDRESTMLTLTDLCYIGHDLFVRRISPTNNNYIFGIWLSIHVVIWSFDIFISTNKNIDLYYLLYKQNWNYVLWLLKKLNRRMRIRLHRNSYAAMFDETVTVNKCYTTRCNPVFFSKDDCIIIDHSYA